MTIVFSRVWNPCLAEVALKTARHNCPDCRVVYLHDESAKVNWPDSFNMSHSLADALRTCCSRMEIWGPNDSMFEVACVARWKIIIDWMRMSGEQEVCTCDSDVLFFENPFKSPHYQPGKIHTSHNKICTAAASNAIVTLQAIESVWAETLSIIQNPDIPNGSINDMVPWTAVSLRDGYVDQNTVKDGVAWDHNMGWTEGEWEDDGAGYKNIQWIDRKPHCLHIPTGKLVRLVNLHCWGDAEAKMAEYAALGGVNIE